jgi:tetratricopeptide (TPR) repeat protein
METNQMTGTKTQTILAARIGGKEAAFHAFVTLFLITLWLPGSNAMSTLAKEAAEGGHEASARFYEAALPVYLRAVSGEAAALAELKQKCVEQLEAEPQHTMALAFHGATLVYECGPHFEGGDFQKGMLLWSSGMDKLNRAVKSDRKDPWVRLLRGTTYVEVWQHDPMSGQKLAQESAEDLDFALAALPDLLGHMELESRGNLLYKLALAWEHIGEMERAREQMQHLLEAAADSTLADPARSWLAESGASDPTTETGPSSSLGDVERFDLLVRDDFFAGLRGDYERAEKGMQVCEQALAENPRNAGALSWHGYGLLLRSRRAVEEGRPDEAAELQSKGFEELNLAVAWQPENVGPLLVRGSTFIYSTKEIDLPEGLRGVLLHLGVYDYERVYQLQTEQGYFSYLSPHSRGELLTGLADGWHRLGNTDKVRHFLERVREEVPDSKYSRSAESFLSGNASPELLESRSCKGCH